MIHPNIGKNIQHIAKRFSKVGCSLLLALCSTLMNLAPNTFLGPNKGLFAFEFISLFFGTLFLCRHKPNNFSNYLKKLNFNESNPAYISSEAN